jgi:hypothetical protein
MAPLDPRVCLSSWTKRSLEETHRSLRCLSLLFKQPAVYEIRQLSRITASEHFERLCQYRLIILPNPSPIQIEENVIEIKWR